MFRVCECLVAQPRSPCAERPYFLRWLPVGDDVTSEGDFAVTATNQFLSCLGDFRVCQVNAAKKERKAKHSSRGVMRVFVLGKEENGKRHMSVTPWTHTYALRVINKKYGTRDHRGSSTRAFLRIRPASIIHLYDG